MCVERWVFITAEIIAETLIGLFLIYMGYRVRWKGEIAIIHRYHYANLSEKTRIKFCKGCGIGEIIVGIGCVTMPYINLISQSELGYWIGLTGIGVGFLKIVLTIIKYNGRLF